LADDAALADAVEKAIAGQLKTLPRGATAAASWDEFGAIMLVRVLTEALPLVDRIAPEHLEITAERAEALADKVRNAGAIGSYTDVVGLPLYETGTLLAGEGFSIHPGGWANALAPTA
jgi:histidinol dehydrogenase